MELTPEQENEYVERNMPKIYRAVDNFTARCSSDMTCLSYEDYVQEVALAFILYLRRCETPEEADRFPWFSAMDAMRNLVLSSQPMSCPKSSHRFSEIIHSMPATMSLETLRASSAYDVDGMSKHWVDDKDTQIDFDAFMSDQPEHTRRIASMRVYGMTLREIGDQCGVTKGAIRKKFSKLYDEYKVFTDGAEFAPSN